MKISELSQITGVSIPTIKYYIREGLVPPGARSSKTQADYGPEHIRRLRLIRTLADVGDVPLASIGHILAVVDDPTIDTHDMFGVVHSALAPPATHLNSDRADETINEVTTYIEQLGWNIKPSTPAIHQLAHALITLRQLGWDVNTDVFAPYVRAADQVAEWELEQLPATSPRTDLVEGVVIGTIVFETVLTAWRRLAEQHHSARRTSAAGATKSESAIEASSAYRQD
ncbi:MAG: MerR family transcriptional regulator [Ilumatobacter sp.]